MMATTLAKRQSRAQTADPAAIARKRADVARKRFRANPFARMMMWRELASLLDRLDLVQALEVIQQGHNSGGQNPNDLIAMVAEYWIPRCKERPFSDVVSGAVSPRERLIIAVGQSKPDFPRILARLSEVERRMVELRQKSVDAMIEPLKWAGFAWLALIAFSYMVLWQTSIIDEKPKGTALIVSQVAETIFYYVSWIVPTLLAVLFILIYWALRRWLNDRRVRYEGIWPFSTYKQLAAGNFLFALQILQSAGDDVSSSLKAMAAISDPYLQWQIARIEPLTRSKSFGAAFLWAGRVFPDGQVNALMEIFHTDNREVWSKEFLRITEEYHARVVIALERQMKSAQAYAQAVIGLLQVVQALLMVSMSIS